MKAVEFTNFTKRNGDFTLRDLTFHVEKGYITGLIGPNGSGKTTLIKAIMNLIRPDFGEVRLFGRSYRTDERSIKRSIGFVYDDNFFYNHLTVREMKRTIASFYPSWNDALFEKYRSAFGLPDKHKMGALSKGMKTKFALAAALAHEPDLLIMDEPTSGLDPVFRREVLALLSEYILDGTRSVLFSTHITDDLERIADYILHIRRGELLFSGSKEELLERYSLITGPPALLASDMRNRLIGWRETPFGFEGLARSADFADIACDGTVVRERPSLEDILVYTGEAR